MSTSDKSHLEFKLKILQEHRRELVEQLNCTITEIFETKDKIGIDYQEIPDREPNDLEDK